MAIDPDTAVRLAGVASVVLNPDGSNDHKSKIQQIVDDLVSKDGARYGTLKSTVTQILNASGKLEEVAVMATDYARARKIFDEIGLTEDILKGSVHIISEDGTESVSIVEKGPPGSGYMVTWGATDGTTLKTTTENVKELGVLFGVFEMYASNVSKATGFPDDIFLHVKHALYGIGVTEDVLRRLEDGKYLKIKYATTHVPTSSMTRAPSYTLYITSTYEMKNTEPTGESEISYTASGEKNAFEVLYFLFNTFKGGLSGSGRSSRFTRRRSRRVHVR